MGKCGGESMEKDDSGLYDAILLKMREDVGSFSLMVH